MHTETHDETEVFYTLREGISELICFDGDFDESFTITLFDDGTGLFEQCVGDDLIQSLEIVNFVRGDHALIVECVDGQNFILSM